MKITYKRENEILIEVRLNQALTDADIKSIKQHDDEFIESLLIEFAGHTKARAIHDLSDIADLHDVSRMTINLKKL